MMVQKESAVSAVIGEVLMIALVLILVPIVTISLLNQLPEDRVPTVTIKMGSLSQSGELHLYHKGGDWIKREQILITCNGVENRSWESGFTNLTFDLGDNLTLSGISQDTRITFVARNAVIFSGVARS
ncbi:MAG: type IV pilin N-terminal domain-containing protein [Methanospirillum sp.]|uniref:type IV pilin N-terminal domain-containing protein n=1 Tax=Methanospirillum sp. TaxID=45200 RepID=UPI0023764772|nr:type IV pilin N-terminal domain-containing protein [Methanospirillum sp.]MDD1728484.1 type IV pilin N-terminal domain-containing protein [Methanospirillum sp.]